MDDEDINNMVPTLLQGAIATHEMYKAYREAGFTRTEALELIAHLMKLNAQPPTN